MNPDATIFVLDDDLSFVQALGRLLRAEGLNVRAWTSASAFLAEHDADAPGCLLADLQMPEMSGLELQRRLLAQGSIRPVIFITGRGDMSSAVEGMRAGAVNFLPKPVNRATLLDAVAEALRQDVQLRSSARERQRVMGLMASLTTRERQVLDFVVRGYLNKQIAAELGTAEKTVKVHRGRLMHKLQARSVATLVQMLNSCEAPPLTRQRAGTAGLHHTSSPASL